MALFTKRKRSYRKRHKHESLADQLNWTINPDTAREAVGVILLLLGVLITLGLFGLAGSMGLAMINSSRALFGTIGFVIPFVFIFLGVRMLMPRSEDIQASVSIGILMSFVFIPALFSDSGGAIGSFVSSFLRGFLGSIGAFIALVALSIASLLIATNLSIAKLMENLKGDEEDEEGIKVNDNSGGRVPLFNVVARNPKPATPSGPETNNLSTSIGNWELPPLDLLEEISTKPNPGDLNKNARVIEKTLNQFGINVKMQEANVGPTVTQYTLKPDEGVKLNQITARSNDIALALAAKSLRIEAPIPGQAAVGVELPNKVQATVTLREVLETNLFQKRESNLSLALGLDVAGKPKVVDLKKMPHLLIAGSTGSGKSVCINATLLTLLYQNSPEDLRLLLIDPKRVEFTEYNGIGHLLTPVITEVDKTVNALRWAVAEMERRYQIFEKSSRRNIEAYNQNPTDGKMPYIVVIIDELADLMAQAANEVEASIVRLAQMARATGIHLIVATQRPSVNVITGLIKANIATRIAFQTASQVDSRTILDVSGSEKLLGRGDMLFLSAEIGKPQRVQGVNVTDKEIHRVNEHLKKEGDALYDETITAYKGGSGASGSTESGGSDDPKYQEAKQLIMQSGKASASFLQRRMQLGYSRAARLLDAMEAEGFIGPQEGSKPRQVLVAPDDHYSQE